MAFLEGHLQVSEEVFETRLQHFGDKGFGSLPFAGDVELWIVVRSLRCMGEECLEVGISADTVGDVGTDARGLSWSGAER